MPEQATNILALLQTTTAGIDSQFEFWLTLTFALVVSTFLAGGVLTRGGRVAIAILYILAVYLVWLQQTFHVELSLYLLSLLSELGVEVPSASGLRANRIRTVIFFAGSLAAVVFVVRPGLVRSDGGPSGSVGD